VCLADPCPIDRFRQLIRLRGLTGYVEFSWFPQRKETKTRISRVPVIAITALPLSLSQQ
jgi:hypothetical protein